MQVGRQVEKMMRCVLLAEVPDLRLKFAEVALI